MSNEDPDVKNELLREFAERLDRLNMADDIVPGDVRYIVDNLINELRRSRVVTP